MVDFPLFATEPCGVCGAPALYDTRCDDCQAWLCDTHLTIEAQAWDVRGWDGVDFRCPAHRRLTPDVRELYTRAS
jgi:hypothetical protein